jgi:plasmid stabilization system protein ParE
VTRFDIEVLPDAEAEIRAAFLWYFERSPIAADAFRTEALDAIDLLETDALMWQKMRTGFGAACFVTFRTRFSTRSPDKC